MNIWHKPLYNNFFSALTLLKPHLHKRDFHKKVVIVFVLSSHWMMLHSKCNLRLLRC